MTSQLLMAPNVTRCRVANHLFLYQTPYQDPGTPSQQYRFGPISYHPRYTTEERQRIKRMNRGFTHAFDRKR
jgi:hypothetical protein